MEPKSVPLPFKRPEREEEKYLLLYSSDAIACCASCPDDQMTLVG